MRTIEIEAYHGTARKNTENITSEGFISTIREDHWLGQGIYFYSDYTLALWWIKTKMRSKNGNGCAVVKATMACEENLWLDLDTIKGMDYFFREVSSILSANSSLVSLKFKAENEDRRIKNFCFALDLLKNFRGIKLMAMTFRKDNPSYAEHGVSRFENSFFPLPLDFGYQERQICSTSNDIIKSKTVVFPN
jgi:hypothetical protein